MNITLKLLIFSFILFLLSGCMPAINPECQVSLPQINLAKPETLNIQIVARGNDVDSCKSVENIKTLHSTFYSMLKDTTFYDAQELNYLSEVLSFLSSTWKKRQYFDIDKEDTPRATITYNEFSDIGKIYSLNYAITASMGKIFKNVLFEQFLSIGNEESRLVRISYDLTGNKVSYRNLRKGRKSFSKFGFTYWGDKIKEDKLPDIKDNLWTTKDIKENFGPPIEEKFLPDGSKLYSYYYEEFGRSRLQALNPFNGLVKDKTLITQVLEFRVVDGILYDHTYEKCTKNCGSVL